MSLGSLGLAERACGFWSALRTGSEDPERGQAIVRLILVPLAMLYMTPAVLAETGSQALAWLFVAYFLAYLPVAALLLRDIIRRPGDFPRRRALAMGHDYLAMTFAISAGGVATTPVYALLLWVTIGNGLRFGPRYLLAATGLALFTLAIAAVFNSYWRANPYLVATLALTTLLVPAYTLSLLARTRKAHAAAVDANLAKSRFLAQASHDLRQPIHAISLFTACLRDAGLRQDQRRMVENIDRSLQSVSGLFRSLLDISTLDSGQMVVRPEPVAIAEMLEDLARQNSEAAQWARTPLRVRPSRLHVQTDPTLLATMLQNVLANALKYAPGKPVLVGCRRRANGLAIEIHDQGPGIAAEHLPRIFDEFYQARERGERDVEGVGLGLSIVRRLGEQLGLEVSLRSALGRGTVVTIAGLPIIPAPARLKAPGGGAPSLIQGMRIMLVEDDEEVLLATATLLERWGCVVQAQAGPPACPAECDILITDFDLGAGMTGGDCIATIRQLNGAEIPAIVMTGHNEARVRRELGDPAIPILAKPVRPAELRSLLTTQALEAGRMREGATR
jgi:signal transduction histidine kinase